jgi:hydrogenase 3 maturation protease
MTSLGSRIAEQVRGRTVAVVGIGNRLRGDDGAGPAVIDRLGDQEWATVIDAGPIPENYLDALLMNSPEVILFIDAVSHGGPPGTWCFETLDVVAERCDTTHAPSLRLLAELLEANGSACWLLGIQPGRTEFGEGLTAVVESGVRLGARALAIALSYAAHPHEVAHG